MQYCSYPGVPARNEQKLVKFEGSYPEKKWAIKELNPDLPSDWSGSRIFNFRI